MEKDLKTAPRAKRQATDYPIIVRVIDRHLVVTSPDFNFPIPIVVPFLEPNVPAAGRAVIQAYVQISNYLKELNLDETPHPIPTKKSELGLDKLSFLTPKQTALILGVSPQTVRRMCDQGELKYKKLKSGYRKIFRTSVEEYLKRYNHVA